MQKINRINMKLFENLNSDEKDMLLKFPAYISLLAAYSDEKMDEVEKKEAIKFTHIKTYSCNPLLSDFYAEVDKVFAQNIEKLNNELPKEKMERDQTIRTELAKLEPILLKLGKEYASIMHISMKSYTEHVSKAHHNILESFLIPFNIKGLTD
jgi:hypothetical protein